MRPTVGVVGCEATRMVRGFRIRTAHPRLTFPQTLATSYLWSHGSRFMQKLDKDSHDDGGTDWSGYAADNQLQSVARLHLTVSLQVYSQRRIFLLPAVRRFKRTGLLTRDVLRDPLILTARIAMYASGIAHKPFPSMTTWLNEP